MNRIETAINVCKLLEEYGQLATSSKMHLANMDLGEVSDSLRLMGANDLADKVDEIRVELFVNGPHNEVILKKENE